jgi:hypothetical protein
MMLGHTEIAGVCGNGGHASKDQLEDDGGRQGLKCGASRFGRVSKEPTVT